MTTHVRIGAVNDCRCERDPHDPLIEWAAYRGGIVCATPSAGRWWWFREPNGTENTVPTRERHALGIFWEHTPERQALWIDLLLNPT